MTAVDTLDKIVPTYFAAVATEPFVFRGRRYEPRPLDLLPCLWRGYGCPAGCGACCPRFSLVYLPGEPTSSPRAVPAYVEFNGRRVMVLVDAQQDHRSRFCRHLRQDDGRCGVHGRQPFSCDFEIVRFKHYADHFEVGTLFYGRAWNMLRVVDDARGALCTIESWTEDVRADLLRKFTRLQSWTAHFKLRNRVAQVIELIAAGPRRETVRLA